MSTHGCINTLCTSCHMVRCSICQKYCNCGAELSRLTQENTRLRARLQEAEHLMTQVALIVENAYLAHKPDSKYDLAVSLLRQFLADHQTEPK